jgi:2-keto-4-pentenoate hydratase
LLLAHLGDHCGGLQVGQTVITGSLCGLPWFTPDAIVTGWIAGFGEVSINLQAADPASETD